MRSVRTRRLVRVALAEVEARETFAHAAGSLGFVTDSVDVGCSQSAGVRCLCVGPVAAAASDFAASCCLATDAVFLA